MKKIILFCIFSAMLFSSCAISGRFRDMTPQERDEATSAELIQEDWLSFQFLHIRPSADALEAKAVRRLEEKAIAEGYDKNKILIRDVMVEGNIGRNLLHIYLIYIPCLGILCNFQTVTAYGSILQYEETK